MLQTIHDKAKGWIAYAIVGLITIPFALFGINQYFEGGGKMAAATVNGEEIQVQQVQNALLEMKQQFGGQLPAGLSEDALKTAALDSVINQTLLRQKIQADGYRASNQEVAQTIAEIPAFQKDGKFDKATYENFLKVQRRDPGEFEIRVRDDLSQQQLRNAVMDTAFVPKTEAENYQALRNQQREVEVFTLKAADFKTQLKITNEEIAKYYDAHKASYMTDEKLKVAYVDLKRDDLAAKVKVDEGILKQWFNDNADHYVQPEERTASHILVAVDDPAKDAEAKKKIDELYANLQAKKQTFEEIAKANSDDKLTAEKGGLIGAVVAGDWGPEFEKAVNALKVGETSAPVKTEAGYEIIKVSEIKPAVKQTFEQARTAVEEDYRRDQADKEFTDKADQIQKLAYENEGDLAPVAKAIGLTVQQSDWFTRAQGQGIATDEKVRTAAFSDDVKAGKNSDLLELADGHAVIIRMINQETPAQKPLESVREDILTVLGDEGSRKLAASKGDELFKKISTAQSWTALKDSGVGAEENVQKAGFIGRMDNKLAVDVVQKAFTMNQPAAGKMTWDKVTLPAGDVAIIALKAVKAGDTKIEAGQDAIYGQSAGMRELSAVFQALRESAEIETHPENL